MNASSPAVVFLGIFSLGVGGLIFATKVWAHYQLKKPRLVSEPPLMRFDTAPEATPGIFLRHFNSPQRTYLRSQVHWGRWGYIVGSCFFFVFHSYTGFASNAFWSSFLSAVFAGFTVQRDVIELRFVRTRPLTLRFLFWGRTGVALTSLLAAIATVALGFFLLLLILYGPAWNHVPSAISGQWITDQEAHHLISTLQTSPLRLVLSQLTTSTLIFSLIVAHDCLLWSFTPSLKSKFATTLMVLYWILAGC